MAKKIKILTLLLVVLLSLPGYYRNKVTIDLHALQAWNELKMWWVTESPEARKVRQAMQHPLDMGARGKSQREANAEAIKQSEKAIDAQLERENAKPETP